MLVIDLQRRVRDRESLPQHVLGGPADPVAVVPLPYEDVRTSADPKATLLDFLQSAYEAGADAAGWDRDELLSSWCPPLS